MSRGTRYPTRLLRPIAERLARALDEAASSAAVGRAGGREGPGCSGADGG